MSTLSDHNSTSYIATSMGHATAGEAYDEMVNADGSVRAHWREFDALMQGLGANELSRRWEQANRLSRENGMTYNAYGDPRNGARFLPD
jgi:uncharacterized circularly permuted ATP-grasp superfamily protein